MRQQRYFDTSEGRKWKTLFFGSCSVFRGREELQVPDFPAGGGAAHIPARHLTWRPVGARMGRGRQGADAILDLDVGAV